MKKDSYKSVLKKSFWKLLLGLIYVGCLLMMSFIVLFAIFTTTRFPNGAQVSIIILVLYGALVGYVTYLTLKPYLTEEGKI